MVSSSCPNLRLARALLPNFLKTPAVCVKWQAVVRKSRRYDGSRLVVVVVVVVVGRGVGGARLAEPLLDVGDLREPSDWFSTTGKL